MASLALKGNSPSGARRADVVCGTNFENLMHLGEYARIIAFGDEILRCKISHHISLAPLDSFSSRRCLDPYHSFSLFDNSEFARIMKVPAGGTTQGRSLRSDALSCWDLYA